MFLKSFELHLTLLCDTFQMNNININYANYNYSLQKYLFLERGFL